MIRQRLGENISSLVKALGASLILFAISFLISGGWDIYSYLKVNNNFWKTINFGKETYVCVVVTLSTCAATFALIIFICVLLYCSSHYVFFHFLFIILCVISVLGDFVFLVIQIIISAQSPESNIANDLYGTLNQTTPSQIAIQWMNENNCSQNIETCKDPLSQFVHQRWTICLYGAIAKIALSGLPLIAFIIVLILMGCSKQDPTSDDITNIPSDFNYLEQALVSTGKAVTSSLNSALIR